MITSFCKVAFAWIVCGAFALGQGSQLPKYTVATLPSATTQPHYIVQVIDGASSTDCFIGGGSQNVVCISNGTSWTAQGSIANGGTGATTAAGAWTNIFSGASIATNCAILSTGSGGALTCSPTSYLPLTGGTLTGTLNGTSASFSGNVAAGAPLPTGTVGLGGTSIDPVNGISGPNYPGYLWIAPSSSGYNNQLQLWGSYDFNNWTPLTPPDAASTIYTDPTYGQTIDWNFIQDSTGTWYGAYSVCFPQGAATPGYTTCPTSMNFLGVASTPNLVNGYQFVGYVTDTRGTASFDYTPRWFCDNAGWRPSAPCPSGSQLYYTWSGSPSPDPQYVPITSLNPFVYGTQATIGGLSSCTLDANIWHDANGYHAECSAPGGGGNIYITQFKSTSPMSGYTPDTAVGTGGLVPNQLPGLGSQSSVTYQPGTGLYYLTYDWGTSGGATFTGTGSGTTLTVTGVTGYIILGSVITGTGVSAAPVITQIVSQSSGTIGGAGTYITSTATTSSAASLTATGVGNNIRIYQTSTDGVTWGAQTQLMDVVDTGGPFSAIAQFTPILAFQGGKTYADAQKAMASGLGNSGASGFIGKGAYTWNLDTASIWGGVAQNLHQMVIGHPSQYTVFNSSGLSFAGSATMANGKNFQGTWFTQDSSGNSGIGTVNSQNYLSLGTNYRLNFSSTTAYTGAQDVGIKRASAGVLNITNGAGGLGNLNSSSLTAYNCTSLGSNRTITGFATNTGWSWSSPTITGTAATGTTVSNPSWTAGTTAPFCVTYTVSGYTSGAIYPIIYDNTTSTSYPGISVIAAGTYGPVLIAGAWEATDSITMGFSESVPFTGTITTISVAPAAGGTVTTGSLNPIAKQTTQNCSTSGTAAFSEPFQGPSDKRVIIHLAACLGTASYTYPTAFTNSPSCYASSLVACTVAGTISSTAVTVTGTTSTGSLTLEDY